MCIEVENIVLSMTTDKARWNICFTFLQNLLYMSFLNYRNNYNVYRLQNSDFEFVWGINQNTDKLCKPFIKKKVNNYMVMVYC